MAKWEQYWPAFEIIMKERLRDGHDAYGDGSFKLKPSALADEIQQELMDVVGWAFIMWCRLRDLQIKSIHAQQEPEQLVLPFSKETS